MWNSYEQRKLLDFLMVSATFDRKETIDEYCSI